MVSKILGKFYNDLELLKASCKHPTDGNCFIHGSFDIKLDDKQTIAELETFFGCEIDLEVMNSGEQIKAGITRMEIRDKIAYNPNIIWHWQSVLQQGGYEYLGKLCARYWHERPITTINKQQ